MVGIAIFTLGLAKKNLIADPTSLVVAPAFEHAADLQLFSAWRAALSYSLQLYFDFSGYSDMAIGLGRMFRVRFPLNFNSPYKAASVIDYWQRWHMTLTRYLTQYLFNPLALAVMHRVAAVRRGQRRKVLKLDRFTALILVPLPITMTIAGISGTGQVCNSWYLACCMVSSWLPITSGARSVRAPPRPLEREVISFTLGTCC